MTTLRAAILMTGATVALACVSGDPAGDPQTLVQAQSTSAIWVRQGNGTGCSGECTDGTCNCIGDRCPAGTREGGSCTPAGDFCNLVSGSSYLELQCVAQPPPPPDAPPPPRIDAPPYIPTPDAPAGPWHRIANALSGLCLTVDPAGNDVNGAAVVQDTCDCSTRQDWKIVSPTSLQTLIRNRRTGKCLDVVGDKLVQNLCDGRGSELFTPNSGTRQLMDIRAGASAGFCLEVPGGSRSRLVQIQQAGCIAPTSTPTWWAGLQDVSQQLWLLIPIP